MEKKPYKSKSHYKSKDKGFDKRKKYDKPQIEEEVQEEPGAAPVLSSDFPSLTLVNAQHVTVGSSADTAVAFAVTDVIANPFSNGMWSLIKPIYDEYIRAYATARGYTSVSIADDIQSVVENSFVALGNLLALKRAQDAKNIRTQNGINVGRAVTDRLISSDLNNVLRGIAPTASTVNANGISNADWASIYTSRLRNILLPKSMVDLAIELYSVAYSMGGFAAVGNDSVIQLFPFTTDLAANYTARMNIIDTALSTHPDLRQIMESLGFVNDNVQQIDFSRDLNGETYPIVKSPAMVYALRNGFVLNRFDTAEIDDDIRNIFVDYTGDTSIFNFIDTTATTPDAFLAIMLRYANNNELAHSHAKIYFANGVYGTITADSPLTAITSPVNIDPTSAPTMPVADLIAVTRRLSLATSNYSLLFGGSTPFAIEGVLGGATAAAATLTGVGNVVNTVAEGASTYVWNLDEFSVFGPVMFGVVLHGASWRSHLTEMIRSHSRQSSNIKY